MKLLVSQSISGCHCERARQAHDEAVKAGIWKPKGVPQSYLGQDLHLAGSAITMKKIIDNPLNV